MRRLGVLAVVACSSPPAATRPTPPSPPSSPASVEPPAAKPPVVVDARAITLRVLPAPAYVELSDGAQLLNCDLLVESTAAAELTLVELQVTVLDRAGKVSYRKFLDGNGVSPSITTIPNRAVPASKQALVLNPLFAFPRDLELATVRFELVYAVPDGAQRITATADVAPVVYKARARLALPLAGRLLVWDGHDFLSHHRRWDYVFAPIRAFGFDSNPGRYSYDLVHVDDGGEMVRGDKARNASWLSWGQPVLAPAAGTVVAVVGDRPDDRKLDMDALPKDLMVIYGNYIVIDHGNGEHSLFAHLQQHSAKVARGARVVAGQPIAAIGASGSALFPHLHYQLQTTADAHAEGLPSYFVDFVRVRGGKRIAVAQGQIDSGEFVESTRR